MSSFKAITNLWFTIASHEDAARALWEGIESKGALPDTVQGRLEVVIENTAYLLCLRALPEEQRSPAFTYLMSNNGNTSLQSTKAHDVNNAHSNLLFAVDNLKNQGFREEAARIVTIAEEARAVLLPLIQGMKRRENADGSE